MLEKLEDVWSQLELWDRVPGCVRGTPRADHGGRTMKTGRSGSSGSRRLETLRGRLTPRVLAQQDGMLERELESSRRKS
ncbi:hypothetical protein NDU88_004711 [Pleurodeles waltl]|uniref:Uncharacterized protein n=1 Tax=Pleurodeles waltl TaxID=8319 RepID=A0AAV7QFC0_PLEWA|nr:hypothetical protein NDU88_004711 [Pleurodeles waltl]